MPSRNLVPESTRSNAPYSQIRGNPRRDRVRSGMVSSNPLTPASQSLLRENEQVPRRKPANGGLSGADVPSSVSNSAQLSETTDSLRRTFEELLFLGDCGRRLDSIYTTWPPCALAQHIRAWPAGTIVSLGCFVDWSSTAAFKSGDLEQARCETQPGNWERTLRGIAPSDRSLSI